MGNLMPIVYDAYQMSDYDELTELPESRGHSKVFGGLSPYDLPIAVAGEVSAPDTCLIKFSYADQEPPYGKWLRLSNVDASVQVGRYSRKVLELEIRGAETVLAKGPFELDSTAAKNWSKDCPTRIVISCMRNAVAISAILRGMPETVRQGLLRELAAKRQNPSLLDSV
jgi:hypothetical protein